MNEDFHLRIVTELALLNKGVESINRRLDIQNGRMAILEDREDEMNLKVTLLERTEKENEVRRSWYQNLGSLFLQGLAGALWMVLSFGVLLILQKTGIINLT